MDMTSCNLPSYTHFHSRGEKRMGPLATFPGPQGYSMVNSLKQRELGTFLKNVWCFSIAFDPGTLDSKQAGNSLQ